MSFQNVGTYNAGAFTMKSSGPAPMNGVPTMDADGIASGGAFLVSELEKRDPPDPQTPDQLYLSP